MEAASQDPARQKRLGAFYTPPSMAAKLVEWAVRSSSDQVLDPSFGGLVFLDAARERLLELGADEEDARGQLYGVDLDEDAHANAVLPRGTLVHRDFFEISPGRDIPPCQAVVGNPPYVRYQGFNGSAARAHKLATAAGVRLTRLASSWAPFLIHATSFVAPGGRLAQVLPAELLHAQYATGVVDFLRRSFRRVSIAVFDERVFPGALEEVVLVFADDRGEQCEADVRLVSVASLADLDPQQSLGSPWRPSATSGRSKLLGQLLAEPTRLLYEHLAERVDVQRLGEVASVDIGVVTGANSFFTLTAEEASTLPPALLRPAVSKAVQIPGARLSSQGHMDLLHRGQKALLFVANADADGASSKAVASYLQRGREAGVDQRYKCRVREPWWALPIPKSGVPDLLLTYCSNHYPRLTANEAGVLQTNTIHGVKLTEPKLAPALAAAFYNSLTLLSAELVGRSYGGGVLKLEPTEAEDLLLPPFAADAAGLLDAVDQAIRVRDLHSALEAVDDVVLRGALGLTAEDIQALRDGRERLSARRRRRSRAAR